jgi:hypothetical protein
MPVLLRLLLIAAAGTATAPPEKVIAQVASLRLDHVAELPGESVPDGALLLPSGDAIYWMHEKVFHERWQFGQPRRADLSAQVIGGGIRGDSIHLLLSSGQELAAAINSPLSFAARTRVHLPMSITSAAYDGTTWWASIELERETQIVELRAPPRLVLRLPVLQTRAVSRPLVRLNLISLSHVLATRTAYPFDTWKVEAEMAPIRVGAVDTMLLRRPSEVSPLWVLTSVHVIGPTELRVVADLRSDLRLIILSDAKGCSVTPIHAPVGFLAAAGRRILAVRGGKQPKIMSYSWIPTNSSEVTKC